MKKPVCSILLLLMTHLVQQPRTMRQILAAAGITDFGGYPDSLLNIAPGDEQRIGRYFHVGYHINPSAEGLFILSSNRELLGELDGWELVTLPNESIVYHNSQTHFAPTHSLGISVFNPETRRDRQIYPPTPYQPVRRDFIDRAAKAYKERGEEWFRQNNHHMNPEMFDSALISQITLDAASKSMSFVVRFGDPDNARDPLPFTERVLVRCAPIDIAEQLQCTERVQ